MITTSPSPFFASLLLDTSSVTPNSKLHSASIDILKKQQHQSGDSDPFLSRYKQILQVLNTGLTRSLDYDKLPGLLKIEERFAKDCLDLITDKFLPHVTVEEVSSTDFSAKQAIKVLTGKELTLDADTSYSKNERDLLIYNLYKEHLECRQACLDTLVSLGRICLGYLILYRSDYDQHTFPVFEEQSIVMDLWKSLVDKLGGVESFIFKLLEAHTQRHKQQVPPSILNNSINVGESVGDLLAYMWVKQNAWEIGSMMQVACLAVLIDRNDTIEVEAKSSSIDPCKVLDKLLRLQQRDVIDGNEKLDSSSTIIRKSDLYDQSCKSLESWSKVLQNALVLALFPFKPLLNIYPVQSLSNKIIDVSTLIPAHLIHNNALASLVVSTYTSLLAWLQDNNSISNTSSLAMQPALTYLHHLIEYKWCLSACTVHGTTSFLDTIIQDMIYDLIMAILTAFVLPDLLLTDHVQLWKMTEEHEDTQRKGTLIKELAKLLIGSLIDDEQKKTISGLVDRFWYIDSLRPERCALLDHLALCFPLSFKILCNLLSSLCSTPAHALTIIRAFSKLGGLRSVLAPRCLNDHLITEIGPLSGDEGNTGILVQNNRSLLPLQILGVAMQLPQGSTGVMPLTLDTHHYPLLIRWSTDSSSLTNTTNQHFMPFISLLRFGARCLLATHQNLVVDEQSPSLAFCTAQDKLAIAKLFSSLLQCTNGDKASFTTIYELLEAQLSLKDDLFVDMDSDSRRIFNSIQENCLLSCFAQATFNVIESLFKEATSSVINQNLELLAVFLEFVNLLFSNGTFPVSLPPLFVDILFHRNTLMLITLLTEAPLITSINSKKLVHFLEQVVNFSLILVNDANIAMDLQNSITSIVLEPLLSKFLDNRVNLSTKSAAIYLLPSISKACLLLLAENLSNLIAWNESDTAKTEVFARTMLAILLDQPSLPNPQSVLELLAFFIKQIKKSELQIIRLVNGEDLSFLIDFYSLELSWIVLEACISCYTPDQCYLDDRLIMLLANHPGPASKSFIKSLIYYRPVDCQRLGFVYWLRQFHQENKLDLTLLSCAMYQVSYEDYASWFLDTVHWRGNESIWKTFIENRCWAVLCAEMACLLDNYPTKTLPKLIDLKSEVNPLFLLNEEVTEGQLEFIRLAMLVSNKTGIEIREKNAWQTILDNALRINKRGLLKGLMTLIKSILKFCKGIELKKSPVELINALNKSQNQLSDAVICDALLIVVKSIAELDHALIQSLVTLMEISTQILSEDLNACQKYPLWDLIGCLSTTLIKAQVPGINQFVLTNIVPRLLRALVLINDIQQIPSILLSIIDILAAISQFCQRIQDKLSPTSLVYLGQLIESLSNNNHIFINEQLVACVHLVFLLTELVHFAPGEPLLTLVIQLDIQQFTDASLTKALCVFVSTLVKYNPSIIQSPLLLKIVYQLRNSVRPDLDSAWDTFDFNLFASLLASFTIILSEIQCQAVSPITLETVSLITELFYPSDKAIDFVLNPQTKLGLAHRLQQLCHLTLHHLHHHNSNDNEDHGFNVSFSHFIESLVACLKALDKATVQARSSIIIKDLFSLIRQHVDKVSALKPILEHLSLQ